MLRKLSEESKSAIISESKWENVSKHSNALGLWKLITKTHLGGGGSSSSPNIIPGETMRLLNQRLNGIMQYSSEPLSLYLERFRSALSSFTQAKVDPPDAALVSAIFIANLNEQRFGAFKTHLKNIINVFDQSEYPKTIHGNLSTVNHSPIRQQTQQPPSTHLQNLRKVVDLETIIVVEEVDAVSETMEHQIEVVVDLVQDRSIPKLNLKLSLSLLLVLLLLLPL
jgi:hypothetical protein